MTGLLSLTSLDEALGIRKIVEAAVTWPAVTWPAVAVSGRRHEVNHKVNTTLLRKIYMLKEERLPHQKFATPISFKYLVSRSK